MIRQAAFEATGQWYRGNLHTHSTVSDGRRSPREVVDFYRQNGYHFVALTDHLIFADTDELDDGPGFLILPGIEVHGDDPESRTYHIVGLGGDLKPGQRLEGLDSLQGDVDRLNEHGALVQFAHPYWSGQLAHHLAAVNGVAAIEVYNGVTDVGYGKGYSHEIWDALLDAGQQIWGLAVDDAHWLPWRPADGGLGWVMVKAEELSIGAILGALRQGRFYATTGPALHDVRVEGNEVTITSSPAAMISAIGNRWLCNIARASTSRGISEVRFTLWEGQTYVRAVVTDHAGKTAWSNPIYLDGRGTY